MSSASTLNDAMLIIPYCLSRCSNLGSKLRLRRNMWRFKSNVKRTGHSAAFRMACTSNSNQHERHSSYSALTIIDRHESPEAFKFEIQPASDRTSRGSRLQRIHWLNPCLNKLFRPPVAALFVSKCKGIPHGSVLVYDYSKRDKLSSAT